LERVTRVHSGFAFSLPHSRESEHWAEIRARLTKKAWALYVVLLDKAMYEESAIVTMSKTEARPLMGNETLARVRTELSILSS
jgi:hypothetical protein